MTTTLETPTIAPSTATLMIDAFLDDTKHQNFVKIESVQDLLLDLRTVLAVERTPV